MDRQQLNVELGCVVLNPRSSKVLSHVQWNLRSSVNLEDIISHSMEKPTDNTPWKNFL